MCRLDKSKKYIHFRAPLVNIWVNGSEISLLITHPLIPAARLMDWWSGAQYYTIGNEAGSTSPLSNTNALSEYYNFIGLQYISHLPIPLIIPLMSLPEPIPCLGLMHILLLGCEYLGLVPGI